MKNKPPKKTDYRKAILLSSLVLMLPSSIAVGMVFGYLLDKLFHTTPWLFMLFTLLGTASGFFSLLRGLNKFKDDE